MTRLSHALVSRCPAAYRAMTRKPVRVCEFESSQPRQGVSNAAHLHERCDLICPDLPKSPSGLHFEQVAAPVHVHLRPSCTQSQFTRPMLFNPRIMQRLMTFSMDCAHASPRSFAEAVVVVACPS
jgi:hypothetical protein